MLWWEIPGTQMCSFHILLEGFRPRTDLASKFYFCNFPASWFAGSVHKMIYPAVFNIVTMHLSNHPSCISTSMKWVCLTLLNTNKVWVMSVYRLLYRGFQASAWNFKADLNYLFIFSFKFFYLTSLFIFPDCIFIVECMTVIT